MSDTEHFWFELSKKVGPIPITVQAALEQTKFIHCGLIYLDNTTINYIESDIRRLPRLLNKSESEVAAIMGNYRGSIKDFSFLVGERSVLKMIAATIKEYGFQYFFQPEAEMVQDSATRSDTPENIEETPTTSTTPEEFTDSNDTVGQVLKKIFSYYDSRREHDDMEGPFFERLKLVRVEVSSDQLGELARIFCPFCDPESVIAVTIRRDRPGTWKVSNFSGHIKAKHDDMYFPGKVNFQRRRKRSHREANRSDLADELMYCMEDPDVKIEM